MKTCKRLSALLLALLLAFGIASPAAAEIEAPDAELSVELPDAELSAEIDVLSDAEPSPASPAPRDDNPAMPVITKQPQSITVKCCEEFTLSVEAYIPNGDEVGYRWYIEYLPNHSSSISDAKSPSLLVPYFYLFRPYLSISSNPVTQYSLYCSVYNKTGAGGVYSETATITMEFCPDMPVITKHPQDTVNRFGATTLSVEANIPSGDPIGYEWYWGSGAFSSYSSFSPLGQARQIGPIAKVSFARPSSSTYRFSCIVYDEKDSTVSSGPHRVWSGDAKVTVSNGVLGTLSSFALLAFYPHIGFIFWPLLPISLPFLAITLAMNWLSGLLVYL